MTEEYKGLEQIIADEGKVVTTTVGISMRPMLRARRDTVVISKPEGKRRVGDVVLYRLKSGKCVLHRIIAIKGDEYVIRGDSLINKETGITDKDIFGVLVGFYRGNRYIDCYKSRGYKAYSKLWRLTLPLRFVFWKCRFGFKRIFSKPEE